MYCPQCGQGLVDGSRFCSLCGANSTPPALAPQPGNISAAANARMRIHVQVLAWLYIALGILGVFGALIIFVIFGVLGLHLPQLNEPEFPFPLPFLAAGFGLFLTVVILLFSLPGIVAGYGLIRYRSWARVLTIILNILNLIQLPFGTILGIYGLWVLLSRDGELHYKTVSQA